MEARNRESLTHPLRANELIESVVAAVRSALSIEYRPWFSTAHLQYYFARCIESFAQNDRVSDHQGHTLEWLHPNWPTCSPRRRQDYGRYCEIRTNRWEAPHHRPLESGTAGVISLAVGPHSEPKIAICLAVSHGTRVAEDRTFDFIKLLDRRNPFGYAFLLDIEVLPSVSMRSGAIACQAARLNRAYQDALGRLGNDLCDGKRACYVVASEIDGDKDSPRRHWWLDTSNPDPAQHVFDYDYNTVPKILRKQCPQKATLWPCE